MKLDLTPFLTHPGRRFPLEICATPSLSDVSDLVTIEEVCVRGEAFSQLGTLYLETTIQARLVQPCGRCLRPVVRHLQLQEDFEMPIVPGSDSIDLFCEASRLILSAHDPNVLCRSDCRGLCPICGADLNQDGKHHCEKPERDRRTLGDFLR